jgi:hypothetical protein
VAGPENIDLPIRAGSRSYRQGRLWGMKSGSRGEG